MSVAQYIKDILTNIEKNDIVLFHDIDLQKYIPELPQTLTKSTRKSSSSTNESGYLPRESLTNSKRKLSSADNTKKEKEVLTAKLNQLKKSIEEKTKTLETLRKKKQELEDIISDNETRLSKSKRSLPTPGSGRINAEDKEPESSADWKSKYINIKSKCEKLESELAQNGSVIRVSVNKLKSIPKPIGSPKRAN